MPYIDCQGKYYEGDRQGTDQEVPQRPSPDYIWQNGAWVLDEPKVNAENNAALIAQIEALEAKQHRAIRELILANPSILTASSDAAQRVQDAEAQIVALRAQLK